MQRYHALARLTARGRLALLRAVEAGSSVTAACAVAGVSRVSRTTRKGGSRCNLDAMSNVISVRLLVSVSFP